MAFQRELGMAFEDPDVAHAYTYRPAYPDALIEALIQLPVQHKRALDLGCGTGKIACAISPYFEHVDAVDVSISMLDAAPKSRRSNIRWIHNRAETVPLAGRYDLVTAGASIHWMDHAVLFPRIAGVLAPGGFLAVVEGDGVADAPWMMEWLQFIEHWLGRMGKPYNPDGFQQSMDAYLDWLTVKGQLTFNTNVTQSIEDYTACQHSRASWSRRLMGTGRSLEFDDDLRLLLQPYSRGGTIQYTVTTTLTWGTPDGEKVHPPR